VSRLKYFLISALLALLCTACERDPVQEPVLSVPGIGPVVAWGEVEGWAEERAAEAWPALQHNCRALADTPGWQAICAALEALPAPDDEQARTFIEDWFEARQFAAPDGSRTGLVTGYYEPLLRGSLEPVEPYTVPLYGRPDTLLRVDLEEVAPSLAGNQLRARLEGNTVRPFHQRAAIESPERPLAGLEVIWVDSAADAFFLHVQGSGRVQLEDGRVLALGFADHNGHPYVSIGKVLVERGELVREDVSLFTIRQWLRDHPGQAAALYDENPRYIFFSLKGEDSGGAVGSLNVPLTPGRSIAIDPSVVPLGTPVWLQTRYPGPAKEPLQRLVIAQDTGAAIKGALRADLFWGHGEEAEFNAGTMQEPGSMLVLLPRGAEGFTTR
jgi:membrane-bound lytic murein transglycosylase A